MRITVMGHVSTRSANVNVKHMVRTIRNFSRCVNIFYISKPLKGFEIMERQLCVYTV